MSSSSSSETGKVDPAVIERIRKLMAYAGDASASEGEIENALGHARRLMEKFNLTEEAVAITTADGNKAAYESIVTQEGYARANGIDPFDVQLAWVPCHICDVKFYMSSKFAPDKRGKLNDHKTIIFYGLPRDVAVARAMYLELLATMRAMARFRYPHDWRQHFASYCNGFVARLVQRAKELQKQAPAESGTTAIVLAKDALLNRYAADKLMLTRGKARSSRVKDWSAYTAGTEDGSRVSLGTNQIPSRGGNGNGGLLE